MLSSNNIQLSIIVPVWNAGEKIRRCLDSLLGQTLREIEVICVLDCPMDGTDQIVTEYAAKDSRIVVLKNETNLHVSGSRNRGLEVARGEYIGFSDHDDYREDMTMYETLYDKAKAEDADIVLSDATVIFEDRHVEHWSFSDTSAKGLVSANILPFAHSVNPQIITHCVWHSIYRREMLVNNHIQFKDRAVYLDEDRLFNFETYQIAKSIAYIQQSFYIWDKSGDSVSNTRNYNIAERQITRTQFYFDYLKENKTLTIYHQDLLDLIAIEMKVYFEDYKRLNKQARKHLRDLFVSIQYPLFGGNYHLPKICRKRLKLLRFVVMTYMFK